jgi:hypothetical protein
VEPFPDNGIVSEEFDALLTTESAPVIAPAVVGPKLTDTVTDFAGASVTFDPPVALKPVPEADTEEMARLVLPLFVKLTSCAVEVPTATLPKFTVELLETSCAEAAVGADGVVPFVVEAPEVAVADLLAMPTHPADPRTVNATAPIRSCDRKFRWGPQLLEFLMSRGL